MRSFILLLVLLLTVTLAAPALAGPPTACGLISQAEAAAALGLPVKPGKPTGPNPIGQTICFFDGQGGSAVRYVQLSVVLPPPKLRRNMPASRLFADAQARTSGAKPIAGLGDKAFWGGSGLKLGAGLHVLKGDYYFTVDVARGDAAKDLAQAKKLAQLVLKRLK